MATIVLAGGGSTADGALTSAPLPRREVAVDIDSGFVHNESNVAATIFATTITVPDAPWLRINLDQVILSGDVSGGTGSYLVLTSLEDAGRQVLNAAHLRQWRYKSAYFNGDAVRLELVAHGQSGPCRVLISTVIAGVAGGGDRSLCGPDDDRTLSNDARLGRVVPVGCSVWMIDDLGRCFLSAGHCATSELEVVEFNVPLSDDDGTYQHPPPEDQYAVDPASIQLTNAGTGNDWAYFGCFPNPSTELTPFQAQGQTYTLAMPPPATGQTLQVTGYGTVTPPVSPTWNGAQKTHTGPYMARSGTIVRYAVDTTGGNSGSPIVNVETGEAIGVHTNGGCQVTGGMNSGTGLNNTGLQNALANPIGVCNVDCNDNGVLDDRDIASGTSTDCNLNGLPDECDMLFRAASDPLSPIGAGAPQTFTIASASTALADVELTFRTRADVGALDEWISVDINGTYVGTVFATGGTDCGNGYDSDRLIVPYAAYNAALAGGDADITMTASATVNPGLCGDPASFIIVAVEYRSGIYDCDGNAVLDECDAAMIFAGHPQDAGACPGGSVTFSVSATEPDVFFQWLKDGEILEDAGGVSGATTATLHIDGVDVSDEGLYWCEITDGCVVGQSHAAMLFLLDAPIVAVDSEPVVTKCIGQTALFSITVDGTDPSFTWFRGDEPLTSGGRIFGAETDTLRIVDLIPADAATYWCHVSNPCGEDASEPSDLRLATPQFLSGPQDACAKIGATVNFTAEAVSLPSQIVGYRWKKDGVLLDDGNAVAGAHTETLTISDVSVADAGGYSVLAFSSDPVCFAESALATLTVGNCGACPQLGDMDADGDVDLADLQGFALCFGAVVSTEPACICANVEKSDEIVDIRDWTALEQLIGGPR